MGQCFYSVWINIMIENMTWFAVGFIIAYNLDAIATFLQSL
jgi:hypothetical protein